MLKLVCDRCGAEHRNPEVGVYIERYGHPEAQSLGGWRRASAKLPSGWEEVRGADLCSGCVAVVRDAMRPPKQAVTA